MCGSKPKVKESAAEREQAKQAGKRLLEWSDDGYKDLEATAVEESYRDISSKLKQRANADVEQTGKGLNLDNVLQMAGAGQAISNAKNTANADAEMAADQYGLGKRLGMAKVGQNVKGVQMASLSGLANQGASEARTDAKIELADTLRKSQAIGELAGLGATGWAMSKKTPGTGLTRVDNRPDRTSRGHVVAGGKAHALPR